MQYAIVKDGTVQNVAAADPQFAAENGWIECPEGVEAGWLYNGSAFIKPTPTDDFLKSINKAQAKQRLAETDWVSLPDVTNSSVNPHLLNAQDFYAYRNKLRMIVLDPPVQVNWPKKPIEEWSSP